jgi:hypothetical protein
MTAEIDWGWLPWTWVWGTGDISDILCLLHLKVSTEEEEHSDYNIVDLFEGSAVQIVP